MPAGMESFVVPSLYCAKGTAHAARIGNFLYTAGIAAKEQNGAVACPNDLSGQARRIYTDLTKILIEASASWDDVVKINYYVTPEACTQAGRKSLQDVHDHLLPASRCAGLGIALPMVDAGVLIQVELICRFDTLRTIIGAEGVIVPPGFVPAVEADGTLYVSGQLPIKRESDEVTTSKEAKYAEPNGDLSEQTVSTYGNLGRIISAANMQWSNVIQVHQFVASPNQPVKEVVAARTRYLSVGKFLSTSVACNRAHPNIPIQNWLISVDLEAEKQPSAPIAAPDTWGNPGGPQAFRTGKLLRMHGQVARGLDSKTQYENDASAQAELTYRNIDSILKAGGSGWSNVLHVRSFCKHRTDWPVVKEVQRKWLGEGCSPTSDLVADFFDPKMLVEVEVTACVP